MDNNNEGDRKRRSRAEEVEAAKKKCAALIEKIDCLSLISITQPCKRTLSKLAHSELSFLSKLKLAHSDLSFLSRFPNPFQPLSVNIGHLEAIVHILQQPFITAVSRVCKPLPLSSSNRSKAGSSPIPVHVHIVCTLNRKPVWIIVSDRNPNYISWHPSSKTKGFRSRIQQVLDAARSTDTLRPSSIVLFFSNGLTSLVHQKLKDEFGASELALEFSDSDFDFAEDIDGEWVNVIPTSYKEACILEIKVDRVGNDVKHSSGNVFPLESHGGNVNLHLGLGSSFSALLSQMKMVGSRKAEDFHGEDDFINFDTTALIALVSGISNGCAEELLNKPEVELRHRFKGNYEFVIAQAMSEMQNPIHKDLSAAISGKRGVICESVLSEFKELVLMCGGANEKDRADQLLKCLLIVPDNPSARMIGLPTTRKLALKNKIVFGTGDYWHAPTLTANSAFVRAVAQTGMSLFTIEHRPRALTGN